ncbi:Protein of uncharacterised function (DUF498/DUF598) [Kingella potus]|uniref:Protein of uncharacterized function (DUF498/DUF598) n=1 Tax=Kingella potus TaxID=265175 RepID=A0A377R379_9NEIS|nr:MTH938/NDUFAF3 family protein [Kingella potus]STR02753.1 Protein of uncharacterised function (DUF498/DUF598) [Kingella potus]
MQFQEHSPTDAEAWSADEKGRLKNGGATYDTPVCLIGGKVLPASEGRPEDLSAETFAKLFAEHGVPEIVLVGTGAKQRFLHPRLNAALAAHGAGIEYMSTAAACRTLLMLQSEGRNVWAWLWPSEKAVPPANPLSDGR